MDPGSGAFLFCSPEQSIFSNLRRNDEDFTDLQLWLNSTSNVPDLMDALWQNTSVQEAVLLIHESFVEQPEHEVLLLFSSLGRLPQLTRLFFNTYRFPLNCTLSFRAFVNVFRSNRRLVEFKLWRTELRLSYYGEDIDCATQIQDWATALASSRCLREFRIIKCLLSDDILESPNTAILDPILEALAQIPTLKDVELSAVKTSALGSLSEKGLKKLLQSSTLESLSLQNLDLSEEAVVAVAQALIPKIDLQHTVSSNAQSPPLHTTTSQVKHLRLSGAGTIASMFPKSIREPFQTVLQSNYRLETIHLFDARNLQDEIKFYLKLNRFGRSRLMLDHHGSRQDWIETLIHVRDDLDCLFYFLGINPLLCCEAALDVKVR